MQGRPEHTGRRRWPWLCRWVTANIETSLKHWFGDVEVVRDGEVQPDPADKYIIGFHPHGCYPTGGSKGAGRTAEFQGGELVSFWSNCLLVATVWIPAALTTGRICKPHVLLEAYIMAAMVLHAFVMLPEDRIYQEKLPAHDA